MCFSSMRSFDDFLCNGSATDCCGSVGESDIDGVYGAEIDDYAVVVECSEGGGEAVCAGLGEEGYLVGVGPFDLLMSCQRYCAVAG